MKKTQVFSLLSAMVLLFCGILARGQTISINGPTTVCVGSMHTYNVTPTTGISYLWSTTTNGSVSLTTSNSALVQWGIAGAGWVRVYGMDSQGDTTEVDSVQVTVLALPEPTITTDTRVACQSLKHVDNDKVPAFDSGTCIKVCAYSTVTYTATGAPGSTFTWNASGGTAGTGNPVQVTWNGPGQGSLTVTETTSDGCVGTKTICIEIIESPLAHFVALPDTSLNTITVCDSSTVIFIDKSFSSASSPIVSWQWDFGDGTYSNAQGSPSMPVSHMYTTPGVYTVSLKVTNSCGCSTSETMEVHVDPQTGVKISCPGVVCENTATAYTVDVLCSASSWSVVNGTLDVTNTTAGVAYVTWGAPIDGFGYIMYDPSSCGGICPSITVAKIPIITSNGTIQGETIVCPGSEYIYKLPQWPSTTFKWSLINSTGTGTLANTDQPNEIVLNTGTPGTVRLVCNYTNTLLGCSGTAILNINILAKDTITGADKVCLNTFGGSPSVWYFLAGGNSGDWTLTYPDGVTTTTATGTGAFWNSNGFSQVGTYKLEVSGTTFCPPDPFYIKVDPLPPTPTSIDGPDTICKGVPVKYAGKDPLNSTVFGWYVQNGSANSAIGDESHIKLNMNSTGPFVIHLWREGKEAPYCHSDTITKTVDTPVIQVVVSGDVTPCKA